MSGLLQVWRLYSMTITYYLSEANLCRTLLSNSPNADMPSSVQVLPSPWSHFIPWIYVSYISNVFIPSQHFSNTILSHTTACSVHPLRFLIDTSNLTCPKLNSSSPLKPMATISPSQLMGLSPSSCSGKIFGFLYNFSFSHIPYSTQTLSTWNLHASYSISY